MRIATLGISHEANTFSSVPASLEQWESSGILHGDQIREQYATAEATISGFLALAQHDQRIQVEPLLFSKITPMGIIPADTFEHLVGRMVTLLREDGPWDGVLLALHGAAVSEEYPDADGEILRRVREAVGPDVTVGVTLDMHANISARMVAAADVMTVYQTNPHVDARDQALRAARIVRDTIAGHRRPRMALQMVPIAINILRQGTDDFPVRDLLTAAREAEDRPGVLSVSLVEGYPYADVAEMGMSVVVITDDEDELAAVVAADLAERTWRMREHTHGLGVGIEDALQQAARADSGPVVLLDTGDNVGAGSPADSTHLLAAAQRLGVTGVFCSLSDPEAVAAAVQAGPGAQVELHVGGKTDARHGEPVRIEGQVRVITDGQWEDSGPTHGGFRFFNTGTSVLVHTTDGHDVLLTSRPVGNVSAQQLRAVGLDPTTQPIIIAKGVNSPRATFEPFAAQMIYVATPGVTSADLNTFAYSRIRPVFPFEADLDWSAAPDSSA
ncbi:M81 family metallopeptidase [Pseudactinotalea sp. Z1748]|uniref:M81 family metallopeptidase n=1 Tax=Pseudactinotalea sp. Z1748 TaxID=3413027 RepID=UPI003C7C79DC